MNYATEVLMLKNFLKDLGVLMFSAGEELEKKAEEYRKEREERFKNFEEKVHERKDRFKSRYEEEMNKVKDHIAPFTDMLGYVSKSEVDRLKREIDELKEKLEGKGK